MTVLERSLIELPPQDAFALFTGGEQKMSPILARVRKHIDEFTGDPSTERGRKEIKSFAYRITQSKTYLDGVGKALNDEAKEVPKLIDATRRIVRETLDQWRDEVLQPVTEYELKEAARTKRIKDALAVFEQAIADYSDRSAADLRGRLALISGDMSQDAFEEYFEAACELQAKAVAVLNERIAIASKREAEARELAELRADKEKLEAADRDERIRQEGIRAAEQRAKEAAEAERKRAEEREAALKRQAEQAEANARAKLEDEKRQEAEAKAKREADVAHRASINRAAAAAFVTRGMNEEAAKFAVKCIASGVIPNVSITY